jgi:hypothetical protein
MSGYNPNYFDRKLVNSMKNAISQIVVKEQFPGTAEGQPGLGLGQISDLELQKRMRNKKNTSIFNKNPKQSKEYLELEAEANRRAAAKSQTQTPAQTQAPAPTTTTAPVSSGGGKSLFASKSAIPTNQEIAASQTTANKTGIPTALPTNVSPGTQGITDMDGKPISVQPTTKPEPNQMSNVPGKSFTDRFSTGLGNITTPIAQVQAFEKAKRTAQLQNVSRTGAYSPSDNMSKIRGELADIASSSFDQPMFNPPSAKPVKVEAPAASQQEIQAAQNAAPAPANWASNYAARVAAARAKAKR